MCYLRLFKPRTNKLFNNMIYLFIYYNFIIYSPQELAIDSKKERMFVL